MTSSATDDLPRFGAIVKAGYIHVQLKFLKIIFSYVITIRVSLCSSLNVIYWWPLTFFRHSARRVRQPRESDPVTVETSSVRFPVLRCHPLTLPPGLVFSGNRDGTDKLGWVISRHRTQAQTLGHGSLGPRETSPESRVGELLEFFWVFLGESRFGVRSRLRAENVTGKKVTRRYGGYGMREKKFKILFEKFLLLILSSM